MHQPGEKQTEFDRYANDYTELLRDPIRETFARSNRFFAERKIQVVRGFYDHLGVDTRSLNWLDVGCGRGDLLRLGQAHFKTASGCDPSTGMIKFCADLNVRHQPSPDRLPFESASFDFITLVGVYHHVAPEQRPALTHEAVRLLRPRGILCVIEHNPWNPVTRRIVARAPVDADASLLSARLTRQLLASAGMATIGNRYFLYFPESLYKYFRAVEDALRSLPIGGQYALFGQRP